MARNLKNIYCFISDKDKNFYRAVQGNDGNWAISKNKSPYPLSFNPPNLITTPVEFATNQKYLGAFRNISYPLDFIKDGAAIIRDHYHKGRGIEENLYLTVIEWDSKSIPSKYVLSYYGKFDFSQKKEQPKSGKFIASTKDDSAWGIISELDTSDFSINCSASNPDAIKVLIDSMTLDNNYTFQTVQAPLIQSGQDAFHIIPFVLVNEDGDSSGLIVKSQSYTSYTPSVGIIPPFNGGEFFYTFYPLNNVKIEGNLMFTWFTDSLPSDGLLFSFVSSLGQRFDIFAKTGIGQLVPGTTYNIPFSININFASGERMWFVNSQAGGERHFTVTPIVTNIFVRTETRTEPQIVYGLRPLDYLKQLVDRITRGRFTINSDFFTINNNDIITCGEAIRQIKNAKIQDNFFSFYQTFSSLYWMALKINNGDLFIEATKDVYGSNNKMIDLGDCIDLELLSAIEYYFSEVIVGSQKQDYRHPSGRLEFNSENKFSAPSLQSQKKLDLVTKYRTGCYDIIFLILDYLGESTVDNNGDKSTYLLKITNEQGHAKDNINTFEEFNVDNAILEPIIKTPLDNEYITNLRPTLKGVGIIGNTVNIYVDSVLDGGTVVNANGEWKYTVVNDLVPYSHGSTTGEHVIEATFTDNLAPVSTVNVIIDITTPTVPLITYPTVNDSLYNNKPLITGVAQTGTNINISLNGILIGTVVADGSCRWSFKSPVIPNGTNTISINGGIDTVTFTVDSNVAYPLITYIGSELDGFPIMNNKPLIEGVAIPGTDVEIWLNYISYKRIGFTTSDINGNWSFQTVDTSYIDPVSGLPVVIVPIQNGLNIISTFLVNKNVSIDVIGYKLSRPQYSLITGVPNNTVFNTEYSPKRMMLNHKEQFASVFDKQRTDSFIFEKAGANANLKTTLNGVTIQENSSIAISSLGSPLFIPEVVSIKTKTLTTFAQTLYNMQSSAYIKATFRGNDIYMLPIGNMKMSHLKSDVQEWKLLLSPLTSYITLLNLYKQGFTINLNNGSMFHSDYNSLHMVKYNYTQPDKYNYKEIYEDWFCNRNDAWSTNPKYTHKFSKKQTDVRDQLITRGVSNMVLEIYNCYGLELVDTIPYLPVIPAPINLPEVLLEATINWSNYPEGTYFTVGKALIGDTEVNCFISEKIELRERWEKTILIESSNSSNELGFFFSTGAKLIIVVEGIIKKLQPDVAFEIAREESGSNESIYHLMQKKRQIRFGTAYGLPDYLGTLKIPPALMWDNCVINGVGYTLQPDEKINPSDDIDGHPLYYYNVNMLLKDNEQGVTFEPEGVEELKPILVVDGTAFGLPADSLFRIDLS